MRRIKYHRFYISSNITLYPNKTAIKGFVLWCTTIINQTTGSSTSTCPNKSPQNPQTNQLEPFKETLSHLIILVVERFPYYGLSQSPIDKHKSQQLPQSTSMLWLYHVVSPWYMLRSQINIKTNLSMYQGIDPQDTLIISNHQESL